MTTAIEIIDAETNDLLVCDTLEHCLSCDDGLAEEADEIRAALSRGEAYTMGGGAAGYFIRIQLAAPGAIVPA